MRKLALSKNALKFFERLDAKQFRQVLRKCLGLLENPRPNDSIQMSGRSDFRTDIGEFRIIYEFYDTAVTIKVVGKRNDDEVYK
jgi:mRNA interferase RelE/StbE